MLTAWKSESLVTWHLFTSTLGLISFQRAPNACKAKCGILVRQLVFTETQRRICGMKRRMGDRNAGMCRTYVCTRGCVRQREEMENFCWEAAEITHTHTHAHILPDKVCKKTSKKRSVSVFVCESLSGNRLSTSRGLRQCVYVSVCSLQMPDQRWNTA